MSTKPKPTWIDHDKIIDGFGEMRGKTHYEDYTVKCGRCQQKFVFTAAAQKYVHEVRGVPIKHGRRGAAFCDTCAKQQGEANRARESLAAAVRDAAEAKSAAEHSPQDGKLLLAYIDLKLNELELRWSHRSADQLTGDLRRARALLPAGDQTKIATREDALARLRKRYPR